MNSILSGLAGAGILAVAAGLGWLAWKAWGLFRSLTQSFTRMSDGIAGLRVTNGEMLKGFGEVAVQLRKLSGELEFLRTVMVAGTPPEAEPEAGEAAPAPRTPSGKTLPQFPSWQPYVAVAADVPDAEVSDTEVLEQDDAALVEQEQLDEIRGQGFAAGPEADPTSNPPGVEANV